MFILQERLLVVCLVIQMSAVKMLLLLALIAMALYSIYLLTTAKLPIKMLFWEHLKPKDGLFMILWDKRLSSEEWIYLCWMIGVSPKAIS